MSPLTAPVHVRIADFSLDHADIRRVRFAVFVEEQRVSADIEIDDRDPRCMHVLASVGADPVGTGRIDLDHDGKIGRVAVLASHRRAGIGAALMAQLHDVAQRQGLATVWCNAQTSAVSFYQRLGYRVTSAPFWEAGIEHVRMEMALKI